MTAKHQLSLQEAQALFEYRDGTLYWRYVGSGQRRDRHAVSYRSRGAQAGRNKKERDAGTRAQVGRNKKAYVRIGGAQYPAHYLVWNWHNGISDQPIEIADPTLGLRIENLKQGIIAPRLRPQKTSCPCCSQKVTTPTLDVVISLCSLTDQEEKVMRAIWAGKGHPVASQRIFSELYADDPDGGPPPKKMYEALKVALCHMRKKLKGSGVGILSAGYGAGFKLVLGENEAGAASAS